MTTYEKFGWLCVGLLLCIAAPRAYMDGQTAISVVLLLLWALCYCVAMSPDRREREAIRFARRYLRELESRKAQSPHQDCERRCG